MRRSRFHIGSSKGQERRKRLGVYILRAFADNNAWSAGGSTYTKLVKYYNYPEIYTTDLAISCNAQNGTDDNVTSKWAFGGLNNGPALIRKIIVYTRVTQKSGDSCTNSLVINSISYNLGSFNNVTANWTPTNTFFGLWQMKDFVSRAADFTKGPYISCTPTVGNQKPTNIFNMYIELYEG